MNKKKYKTIICDTKKSDCYILSYDENQKKRVGFIQIIKPITQKKLIGIKLSVERIISMYPQYSSLKVKCNAR